MASLFRNRFIRPAAPRRRRLRAAALAVPLERLEPRLALAGDTVYRPMLEQASTLVMDASMGPSPVVLSKAQVVGAEVKSFVISHVPDGSVVEKWDAVTEQWVDVSTVPTSSNPVELLKLLKRRHIQEDDKLRWIPKQGVASGDTTAIRRAFEMIGFDDGSQPRPRPQGVPQAVQNIVATFDSLGDLVVTWDALSSGEASEDIRYTVTMTTKTAAGSSTQTHVTASTSAVYPGLSPRNVHSFSVTASNTVGTGDGSPAIDGPPSVAYLSDTGFSPADNLTSDRTPTLSGRVLGDASHVRVVIDGDSSDLIPVVDGVWTHTVPATSPLADGDHSFYAVPINTLGEAGAPSQAREFTISTQRPATPTLVLADAYDTGGKGNGHTVLENVSVQGVTDPNMLVTVSVDGVPVVLAKSDATTGAWQCALPELFSGGFDITAVATSAAGVESDIATFKLTIGGVRTVMLDAASEQPVELTPYHILGNQTQGFIVTGVHDGLLEKWSSAENAWIPVPSEALEVTFAAVQAPDLARTVGFAERVRWTPSAAAPGARAAFDVVNLDLLFGEVAPLPAVEEVPGKLVEPSIVYMEPLNETDPASARLSWGDPVDGCGCDSTRYSVEVTLRSGRTAIYSVDSSVHEISIPESGLVRTAAFWSATSAGASGRNLYSAKLEQQLSNRREFTIASQISGIGVNQLARIQLDASPTPVEGQQNSFVLGQTHGDLAYLEVRAVPDAAEAAQGLEAGTFPVVSFDSNKLTSGQRAGLQENPILAKAMFPGTENGEVEPDQARVHFQAGEKLEIAGNVDPSVRDRATIVVEEALVLAGNNLGLWLPVATIPVGDDGGYSYLHEVQYGMSSVRVRLELTADESSPAQQNTLGATALQESSSQQGVVSTAITLDYNAFGIATPPWQVPNQQGFDGHGNYYNSEYTGDGQDEFLTGEVFGYHGLVFPIGPIATKAGQEGGGTDDSTNNPLNVLKGLPQFAVGDPVVSITVDVPAGNEGFDNVLYLAGAASNGDQLSQEIILEFLEPDGSTSTETWTQSFTDWANNGSSKPPTTYPGEHLIKKQYERVNQLGNLRPIPAYTFAYGYNLGQRQLTKITLPENSDIGIVSAIVASAPTIGVDRAESYVLGKLNLTGVDMLTVTLVNESNVGAGGSSLDFFMADQPRVKGSGEVQQYLDQLEARLITEGVLAQPLTRDELGRLDLEAHNALWEITEDPILEWVLEYYVADAVRALQQPLYKSMTVTVPMGGQRTITYVGTNSSSALAFSVQKASGVVGGTASTYLPDWTHGKGKSDKYAANINPSLNGRIAVGQHWTVTVQNAGAGFWGWINRPSARHGLEIGGLPYSDGPKDPAGAQFKLLTQAEITMSDQPEWLKITEEVVGTIVLTAGIGFVLAPAEVVIDGVAIEAGAGGVIDDVTTDELEEVYFTSEPFAGEVDDGVREVEVEVEYKAPNYLVDELVDEPEWEREQLEVNLGKDAIDGIWDEFFVEPEPPAPEVEIPAGLQDSLVSLDDLASGAVVDYVPDEPTIIEVDYDSLDVLDRAGYDALKDTFGDFDIEALKGSISDYSFLDQWEKGFFSL